MKHFFVARFATKRTRIITFPVSARLPTVFNTREGGVLSASTKKAGESA